MSELARSSSTPAAASPEDTLNPRPQPRLAWVLFAAGGTLVIFLLVWPKLRYLAPEISNPQDQWQETILWSLPDTGFRVLTAVVVAVGIAFVLAIVTSSTLPDSLFHPTRRFYTLIAAIPLLAWVYIILAAPAIDWLKGHEATAAATLAVIFPLTVPFAAALHSASDHAIVRHARQLGAGRYWRSRLALRVAAPSMLDALRVASLAVWSVVLFAESQVTMRSNQGIGGILLIWSRNGVASITQVLFSCAGVCAVAVLIAETINAAETIVRYNNGPDY